MTSTRWGSGAGICAVLAAVAALTATPPDAGADETSPRPTAVEQYQLEVLNRTRADPEGEAARFKIDLNEGLPDGTLGPEAREPLAVNFELITAARAHNKDLFAKFKDLPPDHRGSDGRDPTQRGADAGASFLGGVAENNAWKSQASTVVTDTSVNGLHGLLFKDFTATFEVTGRGHRKVMLNGVRDEVGVAVSGGNFGGRTASIVTQDFVTTNRLHVLGVVFVDKVTKNRFYTPGEGLANVQVVLTRQGSGEEISTTTWGSGGWQAEVAPGTYDVRASGGGLPAPQDVTGVVVTDANVKVDFVTDSTVPVPKPAAFTLTAGSAKLTKVGWTLSVTKASLLVGALTLPSADADQISIDVDGTRYFLPDDRGASKVTRKLDAKTGEVRRITVKDAAKNSFSLDVRTGKFKLTLKSAPAFDPTDGSITIGAQTTLGTGNAVVPATAVGKSGKKFRLNKTTGAFGLD